MPPDQAGLVSERGLRNGAKAERLRRQHEIADIGAAIDRAVDAERLVRMNNGDMRRAKEIEILQRLLGVGRPVATWNAECIVELKAAFAPAFQIDAAIFPWKWKIAIIFARSCRRIDLLAEFFACRAAYNHDLPRLAVAPRRGALR